MYEELAQIMHLDEKEGSMPEEKGSLLNRIIATMLAVFAPFVYILAAAGLVQGCLIIIKLIAPAFENTGTYAVLSFISWTPFTFLPAMIAVTASKHFKCNTFIALWCCLALVNPDWGSMAARIAEGYNYLYNTVPAIAAMLIGGFWEVAVIFGVHWGVTPMVMANFQNYGCDSFQAVQTCAVVAQAAACFGVVMKTRDKECFFVFPTDWYLWYHRTRYLWCNP